MNLPLERNIPVIKEIEIMNWSYRVFEQASRLNTHQLVQYCFANPLPLDPDTGTDTQMLRPYSFQDPDVHRLIAREFRIRNLSGLRRMRIRDAFEMIFGVDMESPPDGAEDYLEILRFRFPPRDEPRGARGEPRRLKYDMENDAEPYHEDHLNQIREEPSADPEEPHGACEEPSSFEYGIDLAWILHALYERLAMLEEAYVMMYEHL